MSNKSKFCNFIYDHSTPGNFVSKYNLLENTRKMTILEKTQFYWFFGALERARTDMMM